MSLISEPLETMVRSCGPLRLSAVLDNRSELAGWGAAGARRFRTARGDAFPVVAAISLELAVRTESAPDLRIQCEPALTSRSAVRDVWPPRQADSTNAIE